MSNGANSNPSLLTTCVETFKTFFLCCYLVDRTPFSSQWQLTIHYVMNVFAFFISWIAREYIWLFCGGWLCLWLWSYVWLFLSLIVFAPLCAQPSSSSPAPRCLLASVPPVDHWFCILEHTPKFDYPNKLVLLQSVVFVFDSYYQYWGWRFVATSRRRTATSRRLGSADWA